MRVTGSFLSNSDGNGDRADWVQMYDRCEDSLDHDGRVTPEAELAIYLIGDAMVRMVDRYTGNIDRREAFMFFFSPDGEEEDEKWEESLTHWCDVAKMDVEGVRNIAALYYRFPVRLMKLRDQLRNV